jgi:hypothetical protein
MGAQDVALLLETLVAFFKNNIAGNPGAGDPPPPGKLGDIATIVDKLTQVELAAGSNSLVEWLNALHQFIGDAELRDTIMLRALQLKAPRVAEALIMAGLVDVTFHEAETPRAFSFKIAWDKLDAYMKGPGDASLAALFNRIRDIGDLKIAQVLAAKLLTSPRDLLAMEYAEQGFAALPDEKEDGAVDLTKLVSDLINSPLRIALPFTPPLDEVGKARDNLDSDYVALLGPEPPDFGATGPNKLNGFGLELHLKKVEEFAARSLDLGGGWKLSAATTGTGIKTFRLVVKDGKLDASQAVDSSFDVNLDWTSASGKAVIGPPAGTRLEAGPVGVGFRFEAAAAPPGSPGAPPPAPIGPLFSIRGTAQKVSFVLAASDLGLLGKILPLPAEIKLQGDVAVSYRQGAGLQLEVANGQPIAIELPLPLDQSFGSGDAGLHLEHVLARLELKPPGDGLQARVMLKLGASGQFGPVSVAVDGLGGWFGKWGADDFGLVPPTGFSVSLEAGPVSGGGFLAALPDNQFAGGLDVKVIGIGVGAFALFGEADNAPAFVGVLGIRLPLPGIQIGFGFAVTGVGGVVGINRSTDTDVLREQLATGTSADILFCDDPVSNGLAVIGQLPRLFPATKGVFLIGPTFQISWLELFKIDAGVFIELPGPRQIFVAGSARLVIGTEGAALVYLRADFVGGVDLVKSLIYFDAVLVNSQVLQVFKVTGGVALRIAYGDNGYFLFSIGGFNSAFNPGGLELPALARAGTSASVSLAWLKLENYFALTSNTFQIGAGIEAGVKIGPISAHGWFRFDAMAQFDPFKFDAKIDAGFDVEVKGVSLYGVRVTGTLSGPGPLVVYAKASVKVLFVRISKHVTVRFGKDGGKPLRVIDDLIGLIADEFGKAENLRCEGEDASVVLKPDAPTIVEETAVVGVVGAIIWEQKRVPFAHSLQRFEGVPIAPGANGALHCLNLTSDNADCGPEQDWFGSGSFMNVSDSEALNNARFVQAQSGMRLGSAKQTVIDSVDYDLEIDVVKLPKRTALGIWPVTSNYVPAALAAMSAERAGGAKVVSGGARLKATQEKWNAVDNNGGVIASGLSSTQAFMTVRGGLGTAQPAVAQVVPLQGVF